MADTTLYPAPDTRPDPDPAAVEAFAGHVLGLYASGMLTAMIDLGTRTGLFAAAAAGPATSAELAARAGLQERYVREWLGALTTGGLVAYEPETGRYDLPAEHAECLAPGGASDLSGFAQIQTHLSKHLHQVADAFREGGGVPYAEFRPEFTDVMDGASRATQEAFLVGAWVPQIPGLAERLRDGACVADVGCGTGHAVVLLATAFPSSEFMGYDIAEDAIERGRAESAETGLSNARFEVRDAATLTVDEPFDVVFTFDAIHDQAQPARVLERIFAALRPGGLFVMSEPRASSRLEHNVGNPLAPWMYGISTLHCMTVSLAEGGTGLGTVWGEERARRMLADAGFGAVDAYEAEGDPLNRIFVSRKPD